MCWKSVAVKEISPSNFRAWVSRLQISTFAKTRLVTPRARRLVFVTYFTSETKRGWSVRIALLTPRMSTRPLGWRFQPIFTSGSPTTPNKSTFFQKISFPFGMNLFISRSVKIIYQRGNGIVLKTYGKINMLRLWKQVKNIFETLRKVWGFSIKFFWILWKEFSSKNRQNFFVGPKLDFLEVFEVWACP